MGSILSQDYFHNEEAAYAFIEERVWPNGTVCPHCGVIGDSGKLGGASTRIGVWKCYSCRKPFTVKVGTIFESSHIKLHLWLQAIFLIASSKKGISSNQLHRTLGVTLKSAWFMSHRIREAMRSGDFAPFGSGGGVVEMDETFIGRDTTKKISRGYSHKYKVMALVDRETGQARSIVVDNVRLRTLLPIMQANIDREARVMTDDAGQYQSLHKHFAHNAVNHSAGEYVSRHDNTVHTNTVEGFFSIFKRGMKGVYQHCGHNHLNRYLAEFDFRYNNRAALGVNDTDRAETLLRGVVGKRLTYQTAH
jgi:transposase-like protein